MPKEPVHKKDAIEELFKRFFVVTDGNEKILCKELFKKIRDDLANRKIVVSDRLISKTLWERFSIESSRNYNSRGDHCYNGVELRHSDTSPDTADLLEKIMRNNEKGDKIPEKLADSSQSIDKGEVLPETSVSVSNDDLPPIDAFSPLLTIAEMFEKAEIQPTNDPPPNTKTTQTINTYDGQLKKLEPVSYLPPISEHVNTILPILAPNFSLSTTRIGSGISGCVFEGAANGKPCAVKQFRTFRSFKTELFVHSHLLKNQQGICRAIGYNVEHKLLFLPLLSSADGWHTAEEVSVASTDFKAVLTSMAVCLQGLHTMEVLHNDLKSDNFLVNAITGEVQLIDFGNSTSVYDNDRLDLNFSKSVHIHPLVRKNMVGYCIGSDIYSFGDFVAYTGKNCKITELVKLGKIVKDYSIHNIKTVDCQNLINMIKENL